MSTMKVIVSRDAKTLTVPHSFLIAAGNILSQEYKQYLQLKESYPGFTIVEQAKAPKKNNSILGDLTYANMEAFINGHEKDVASRKAVLEELNKVRALYKGSRGAYLKVREWFLNHYKDEFDRKKAEREAEERMKREEDFLFHPTIG